MKKRVNITLSQTRKICGENLKKILRKQRETGKMGENCMNIVVLKALRLNTKNMEIVDSFTDINNLNGIHIRIESDWIPYSKDMKNNLEEKENILVKLENSHKYV